MSRITVTAKNVTDYRDGSGGGDGMAFLVSQLLFLLIILIGVMVWAASEVPLAWREIALNTRRSTDQGSPYTMLKVLSVCIKIFAVLLWILGIASIVGLNIAGPALGGLLGGSALD